MLLLADFTSFLALLSLVAILVIAMGLILKRLHQPYIIGYILVGILIGDAGLGLIPNTFIIKNIGELGLILLLFFVGMEINLPEFKEQWKISVVGTTLQIALSIVLMALLGYFLAWSTNRMIVLGFVISLSSSAVIIRIIEERGIIRDNLGKNLLSILLTQDMLLAPMLVVISILGGASQSTEKILLLIGGALLFTLLLVYIYVRRVIRLPFSKTIQDDHELQVFLALIFCVGGAYLSSAFGLSPALGAFVGGMVMHAGKATNWIHDTLNSFRILFVSVFFIDIGLQIDLAFIYNNFYSISLALIGVFLTNHFLNTIILRFFSGSWKEAILGGAFLAPIGELSFLLCLAAYNLEIISDFSYAFTISLIAITLVISPFWVLLTESLVKNLKA